MLREHIGGLPVVGETGKLIGIVSEGNFIRRKEIGTQTWRGRWLKILLGPGGSASDFVHEQGRKVGEIMTSDIHTATEGMTLEDIVQLMERQNVKRLPVVRGDVLVGIVTRSDLLRGRRESRSGCSGSDSGRRSHSGTGDRSRRDERVAPTPSRSDGTRWNCSPQWLHHG